MTASKRLNPTQLRVLNFLSSYKDPRSGRCTPYLGEIADACGVSRSYIPMVTRRLDRMGYLRRKPCWEYDTGRNIGKNIHGLIVQMTPPSPKSSDNIFGSPEYRGPNLYRLTPAARRAIAASVGQPDDTGRTLAE